MYVGLDLHKMYTQYAVMDNDGALVREGRIEKDPGVLEEILRFPDQREHRHRELLDLVWSIHFYPVLNEINPRGLHSLGRF